MAQKRGRKEPTDRRSRLTSMGTRTTTYVSSWYTAQPKGYRGTHEQSPTNFLPASDSAYNTAQSHLKETAGNPPSAKQNRSPNTDAKHIILARTRNLPKGRGYAQVLSRPTPTTDPPTGKPTKTTGKIRQEKTKKSQIIMEAIVKQIFGHSIL